MSVTNDFVRKSCVLFATLCDKEADFARKDAATNVDRWSNRILPKVFIMKVGSPSQGTYYKTKSSHSYFRSKEYGKGSCDYEAIWILQEGWKM